MARISWLSISLASKCRILFGSAVLLIIASALLVPWLRMRDLVHETNIQLARRAARLALARSGLTEGGNWALKQRALATWWPEGSERHGLVGPVPRLIPLADPSDPRPPKWADAHLAQCIGELARNPGLQDAPATIRQSDGVITYRTVSAVRSIGGRYPQGALIGVITVDYPAPGARLNLMVNLGLILMAGAVAGVLAVLVFYLITQKLILSPVRELTRVANAVSQGEHAVRSQIATGDEFEELARAFNAMLAHLQASENELRTINKSLDTRLSDLAERNVALFEANKIKSQFLANVSHELRTPLTSIIGFAELLREAASSEGGRMLRYSENIMSSGRLLLGIINDLLDLAKIEAGKLELHLGSVNLAEMCRNLIDFVQPLADKKNLTLVAQIEADCPAIHSDAGRIQQILYNLLSNAVKFTPEGKEVTLELRREGDEHVCVVVRDTGIGIPEEELPRVFEKFHQLDSSMTREHSGTGLGLAISKDLVSMLDGTIQVSSKLNEGSTFVVVLPINGNFESAAPRISDVRLVG